MEEEQSAIEARFCQIDYFTTNAESFKNDQQRLEQLKSLLENAYNQWQALEAKQESLAA